MASVRLENVKKEYEGGVVAVQELSLEVQDKEFVVLVGPSGCGKSTTLRMVAGLEEVTAGSLYIDNQRVNEVPPKDRDIAMVFQNYALYPHLTVYENMAFGLRLRKFPKSEIEQRVREASDILGISDYLNRKPKALSGGQRQRVAVGRAIVRKPKVFLFDEPLSNLDAKLRVQMRTEISRLHQRLGATMIYVTHDQTEAMTMGDRIVLMKDGYVQQIDTPLEIYSKPVNRFVAGFIGSPAMNFFEGAIQRKRGLIFEEAGEGVRLQVQKEDEGPLKPYIGKEIILGLRPENISLGLEAAKGTKVSKAKAVVELVEPMGSETYIYFTTSPRRQQFVARVSSASKPSIGKVLDMSFNMSHAHFFDTSTEKSV